ncbi:MAG: threonylcarbamoyl-AMP synthase [Verrucomicrobia bacterium]|nr:threonylcarbamoyl-AMP synthase [Verrucomicrobiota bacterium]MBS0645898.1 threonylcarbamoyl-AMP synthase [Verrucomicrobiota bacterium]
MKLLTDQNIDQAVALLQAAELVAFPTETVYGLGAGLFLPEAISKIFVAKGRPADNPLIAHISHVEQLDLIVKEISQEAQLLIERFFPGPLTLILPKTERVPACAAAGLSTIGIRMPSHPLAHRLIAAVGMPLVAPSANLSGRPSATKAEHVIHDFKDSIAAVLEGECGIGLESTVLCLDPEPRVLRPGAITAEQIGEVLGREVKLHTQKSHAPQSPGMKYRHYAPLAHVQLCFSRDELEQTCAQCTGRFYSFYPETHTLYANLREADLRGMTHVFIFCDAKVQANEALMNRLMRAAQLL